MAKKRIPANLQFNHNVTLRQFLGFPRKLFIKKSDTDGTQFTEEGTLLYLIEVIPESAEEYSRLLKQDKLTLRKDWETIKSKLKEKDLLPNLDDYKRSKKD